MSRLIEILDETTFEFRKGAEVVEDSSSPTIRVTSIFMMPHESEAPADLEMIDVFFMKVGVHLGKAKRLREELIGILDRGVGCDLSGGPSYITVGGALGSQSYALRLFALGEALNFWRVITPKTMGLDGYRADELAGLGFVMMSGYAPARAEAVK